MDVSRHSVPFPQDKYWSSARRATWSVIARTIKRHPGLFAGWSLSLLASILVMLAIPVVVSSIVQSGLSHTFAIWPLMGIGAGLAVTTATRFYCITLIGEHVGGALKQELFERLLSRDGEFFDRHSSAELSTRMTTDVGMVRLAIGGAWSVVIRVVITGIGSAAMMLTVHPGMTLIALLLAALGVIVLAEGAKRIRSLAFSLHAHTASSIAYAAERLASVQIVRAYVRERHEADNMENLMSENTTVARSLIVVATIVQAASTVLIGLGLIMALRYGAHLVQAESLTVGELAEFALYMGILLLSVIEGSQVVSVLSKADGALAKVGSLLAIEQPLASAPSELEHANPIAVHYRRITFRYPTKTDECALSDVSFSAHPGEITAVVGPSGSGKSTLLALLHRFYVPSSGTIQLGDLDIITADVRHTRSLLALLPQRPVMFRMTVAENIAYGRHNSTRTEVATVARLAMADQFIQNLPHGYDTLLGPGGHALSVGQEQRIAVARALISRAPVLLMDEPTSALDARNEQDTLASLRAAAHERTIIVVTHRPTTMRAADRIIVMDRGRVVDQGTHAELLFRCPIYASLGRDSR
jgi:ATP-binding cassette subfamily B protein